MSANVKTTLGVLTMAAPIVMLGCICTIATVWFSFSAINQNHISGATETTICTRNLYLQIFNGVCSRGIVNGIDVQASCMEWTDKEAWANLDASNAAGHAKFPTKFDITDTVSALPNWGNLRAMCLLSIPLAVLNFIFCLITADLDIELWDIDFDKWTLVASAVFNVLILVAFVIAIAYGQTSVMTQKKTWTYSDPEHEAVCMSSAAPSFGYFLMILGGFFAAVSLYLAVYCIIRAYIFPLPDEDSQLLKANFSTVGSRDVVPSNDEKSDDEDDEEANKRNEVQMTNFLPSHSPGGSRNGSRPSSAVAPAPMGGGNDDDAFNGLVIG